MDKTYKSRYEEDQAKFRNFVWVLQRLKVVDIMWYTDACCRLHDGKPIWT